MLSPEFGKRGMSHYRICTFSPAIESQADSRPGYAGRIYEFTA